MGNRLRVLTVLCVACSLSIPASAITAEDVTKKMTKAEQYSYITGAVDMALHLEQLSARGSTPRSQCILNWYYGKDAKGNREVLDLFAAYPDKLAVGLIQILINRACPK